MCTKINPVLLMAYHQISAEPILTFYSLISPGRDGPGRDGYA